MGRLGDVNLRPPVEIRGEHFPPYSSKSVAACLTLDGKNAVITYEDSRHFHDLTVVSQQGLDNLVLSDESYFKANAPLPPKAMDHLHSDFKQRITKLENFSWPMAISMIVLFIALVALIRIGISHSTGLIAASIPPSWEETIGEQSYQSLNQTVLQPSTLGQSRRKSLQSQAMKMARLANLQRQPTIHFHNAPAIGANALAFPGGPVVVTDDLVKLLDDDQEILAIIAHEFGHIRDRHSLQQVVDLLGTAILVSLIFGADESLLEEIAGIAANGWAFAKSRDHEREADTAAFEIMTAANMDPSAFLSAMEKLTTHICKEMGPSNVKKCVEEETTSWLSTHPSGAERLKSYQDLINQKQ